MLGERHDIGEDLRVLNVDVRYDSAAHSEDTRKERVSKRRRFARHRAGQARAPGPVIGFVGSTDFSTGAHVHYEIVVNGRFVDPMRIRLPRGRVLEGPMLAGFEKERERVEGMMNRKGGAPARVAQTVGN